MSWAAILALGVGLCMSVPLWKALEFGSDEGYELMKAFLVSLGHPLYKEVWNDQPPLHTILVALLFRLFGPSAGVARTLTVAFAGLFLASLYHLVAKRSGTMVGVVAAFLAGASPIFLRLSVSAMLELPAMAVGLASVWMLSRYLVSARARWAVLSGVMFGCALQIKLTAGIFIPAILIEYLVNGAGERSTVRTVGGFRGAVASSDKRHLEAHHDPRGDEVVAVERKTLDRDASKSQIVFKLFGPLLWLGGVTFTFGAIVLAFYPPGTFRVFWLSHFAEGTLKSEKPGEYGFHALSLIENPAFVPAAAGLVFILWKRRRDLVFPVTLIGTVFGVHLMHRPYWYYYEIHFVVPLVWLAAIGTVEWFRAISLRGWPKLVPLRLRRLAELLGWSAVVSSALITAPSQLWNTVFDLNSAPSAGQDEAVLALRRNAAVTHWVLTDRLICAFWVRLPAPPELAVIPMKRIWSGQIQQPEMVAYLERYRPEQLLLQDDWIKRLGLYRYINANYRRGDVEGLFVRHDLPSTEH